MMHYMPLYPPAPHCQEFRAFEPLLLHLTGARYADLNWV